MKSVGIILKNDAVNLPEIEVVGLQPPQRLLELPHRSPGIAAVRADLGHQEHAVATILDRLPHPHLALAVVILPRVVEERDAGIDRGVHDLDGFAFGADLADVVPAERQRRDELVVTSESPPWDFAGAHDVTTFLPTKNGPRRSR